MNIIFIYLKYIVLLNLYLMYIIKKNIHTIIRGYRVYNLNSSIPLLDIANIAVYFLNTYCD
jgi:hypothetical protein